jgi:hypothetical protein
MKDLIAKGFVKCAASGTALSTDEASAVQAALNE